MHTNGERPTSANLSEILERLLAEGIDFILVGVLAAVIQEAPFTTMDVDIVYKKSSENVVKLLVFLKSIDAFYRRLDDKLIEPKEMTYPGKAIAYLRHASDFLMFCLLLRRENPMGISLSTP